MRFTAVRQGVVHRAKEPNDELKRQSARSIWDGTKPLNRSLAEKYLKTHRGISDTSSLNDVRYWPVGAVWQKMDENGVLHESINKIPALVLGARNSQMDITAVQRIYLDKQTGGKNQFMSAAKLSCGVMKGSAGIIQKGDKNGRVYIAEGPETGASIAAAFPKATVLVSFSVSNIANLVGVVKELNPKELIIAADNDGNHTKETVSSRLATEKAVRTLQAEGCPVRAIYPNAIAELKKTDWNDVLKHEGVASIRAQLEVKQVEVSPIKLDLKRQDLSLPEKQIPRLIPQQINSIEHYEQLKHASVSGYTEQVKTISLSPPRALKASNQERMNELTQAASNLPPPPVKAELCIQEKILMKEMEI